MVAHPIVTDLVVVKPLTGEEVARLAIPQYVLDYIELGQHAPGMDGDSMSEDDDMLQEPQEPRTEGWRDDSPSFWPRQLPDSWFKDGKLVEPVVDGGSSRVASRWHELERFRKSLSPPRPRRRRKRTRSRSTRRSSVAEKKPLRRGSVSESFSRGASWKKAQPKGLLGNFKPNKVYLGTNEGLVLRSKSEVACLDHS